jgi:hypothetical protein
MLVKNNPVETHPAIVGHSAQWNDALQRRTSRGDGQDCPR